MRLNLGCGHDHRDGFINVDVSPQVNPDQLVDLETLPLPWADDEVDEILIKHTLEHLGQTPKAFLNLMCELWRICRHEAKMAIVVPHHRHDQFLNDPTHVRAITPAGLELFSRKRNREWIEKGMGNSPLGLQLGIDFELVSVDIVPDRPWREKVERGEITMQQLSEAARDMNNVIVETTIVMRALKNEDE